MARTASVLVVLAGLLGSVPVPATDAPPVAFPRVMGMQIGGPAQYDDPAYRRDLARFDVLVLNFWPQWKEWKYGHHAMHDVLADLKRQNPRVIIGQYTNLNEAKTADNPDRVNLDLATKLDQENWWLRNARGTRQQWTDRYQTFDVNLTAWMPVDGHGQRYPEWYADRNFRTFFRDNPEFSFWYLDNTLSRPAVRQADWNDDGRDDDGRDPAIARAHRLGHVQYWNRIRVLQPAAWLVGNADAISSTEFRGQLNGAFLEALIGKSWSTESRLGWREMMNRYHATMKAVKRPHLVGFGVFGSVDDYRSLRFGLGSCLLDDGYFAYSVDESPAYSSIAWFDEFDVNLGQPLEPPVTEPWQNGVFRRAFEHGLVLVNPANAPARVVLETGYRRIAGRQDPSTNSGRPVTDFYLPGRDGIVLVKERTQASQAAP